MRIGFQSQVQRSSYSNQSPVLGVQVRCFWHLATTRQIVLSSAKYNDMYQQNIMKRRSKNK